MSGPIVRLARVYEVVRPEYSAHVKSVRRDATWSLLITFYSDVPKGFRKLTTYCSNTRFPFRRQAVAARKAMQGDWRSLNRATWSIAKEEP